MLNFLGDGVLNYIFTLGSKLLDHAGTSFLAVFLYYTFHFSFPQFLPELRIPPTSMMDPLLMTVSFCPLFSPLFRLCLQEFHHHS